MKTNVIQPENVKRVSESNIDLTLSNQYIIVDSDLRINDRIGISMSLTIGENVTFQFEGGKIISNSPLELIGNNTCVIAAPQHIFGERIFVSGTWSIDRSYPEWFGAKAYMNLMAPPNNESGNGNENENENENIEPLNLIYDNNTVRSSAAINKAIQMKRAGEVFLQEGFYLIDSPIIMPVGIQLVGTLGYNSTEYEEHPGTVLNPTKEFVEGTTNAHYFIGVNLNSSNENTWALAYKHICTEIRNLSFDINAGSTKLANIVEQIPVAIKAAGNLVVDNVHWWNTPRALEFTDDYGDLRSVTNCHYDNYISYGENEFEKPHIIAFDFKFLGDGLLFQHNAVSNSESNITCIRLSNCGSAEISSNIINGNVEVFSSHGIVFEGNHMEYGARIWIENSSININGNLIEKRGPRPVFVFKGNGYGGMSNIMLQNNYLHTRGIYSHMGDWNGSHIAPTNKEKNYVKNTTDIDILITQNVNLNIQDTYKYYSYRPGYNTNPLGLKMKKYIEPYPDPNHEELLTSTANLNYNSFSDFIEFNDYSFDLSHSCKISRLSVMDMNISIPNIPINPLSSVQRNYDTFWFDELYDDYNYAYQVIYDKNRGIVGNVVALGEIHNSNFNPTSPYKGMLIVADTGSCLNVYIRIFKINRLPQNVSIESFFGGTTNSIIEEPDGEIGEEHFENITAKYVDVPLCGATALYDNGDSVSGFKWHEWESSDVLIPVNTGIKSIHFIGDNVVCNSTEQSINDKWKLGDVLINVGSGKWQIRTVTETSNE